MPGVSFGLYTLIGNLLKKQTVLDNLKIQQCGNLLGPIYVFSYVRMKSIPGYTYLVIDISIDKFAV